MKNSMLLLSFLLSCNIMFAQNTPPPSKPQEQNLEQNQQKKMPAEKDVIPGNVNQQFDKEYPNVNTRWEIYGSDYRAEYIDASTKKGHAVIYNSNAKIIGKEKELSKGEYPSAIDTYILTSHPNEQLMIWMSEDPNGNKTYFVTPKNGRVWFDSKGNPLKVKTSLD